MSGELPAEVQAVIDAALAWDDRCGRANTWEMPWNQTLQDAVDAYRKATAPPEPFEAHIKVFMSDAGPSGYNITTRFTDTETAERWLKSADTYPVWRCTVTPIERVR